MCNADAPKKQFALLIKFKIDANIGRLSCHQKCTLKMYFLSIRVTNADESCVIPVKVTLIAKPCRKKTGIVQPKKSA